MLRVSLSGVALQSGQGSAPAVGSRWVAFTARSPEPLGFAGRGVRLQGNKLLGLDSGEHAALH